MGDTTSTCALCLESADLKRSHIIPEFLYRQLYDEKHRFHVLSSLSDQRNGKEQKGLREQLLCEICEGRFSVWERYASLLLNGGIEITYRTEGNLIYLSGIDYQQFKLFQMSILWRAGISRLPFFKRVTLGPYQEELRKLLLLGEAGSPYRYGCLMFGLKHEGQALCDVIMEPSQTRLEGHRGYRFVFGGIVWVFFVTKHELQGMLSKCILSQDGRALLLIEDARSLTDLTDFTRRLAQMGRLGN